MYQKIIIVGNLGGDPEMRYMPDATAVTNFSVATNRQWTDRATGERHEQVTWFRVNVWGSQAEACNQYLSKGRQVFVEGRLEVDPETGGPRLWTAQDGTVRSSFELRAYSVKFLGGGGDSNGGGQRQAKPVAAAAGRGNPPPEEEDDIPF